MKKVILTGMERPIFRYVIMLLFGLKPESSLLKILSLVFKHIFLLSKVSKNKKIGLKSNFC